MVTNQEVCKLDIQVNNFLIVSTLERFCALPQNMFDFLWGENGFAVCVHPIG